EACRTFNTPVTGGNVSLYNETLDAQGQPQPIYPTPVVGMVGLLPQFAQARGQGWQQKGDAIYILGADLARPINTGGLTLGGTEYLAALHGTVAGQPPKLHAELELAVQDACRAGIRQGWVRSAHDCAEGGLAVALAECCLSGDRGADIRLTLDSSQGDHRWDKLLFGEGSAKIIVSVVANQAPAWEAYLTSQLGDDWSRLGQVGPEGAPLRILTSDGKALIEASLEDMGDRWRNAIPRRMAEGRAADK
ncbi:MAG: AIR synthase-related protein, partial [Cyanobacteria bacterium P01_A01_bin.135]